MIYENQAIIERQRLGATPSGSESYNLILMLQIIEEEKLQDNALRVGTYLMERLGALQLDHPSIIGDVRGKGLMIGVELVCNPETKEPLQLSQMTDVFENIKDMGVLVGKGGLSANVSN